MERRKFLKQFAALSGVALLAPLNVFSGALVTPDGEEIWRRILDHARWSPSPHNIQPWKIKITAALEAQLYCDTKRLIPYSDKNNIFMLITFGVFTEYISIVAANMGYQLQFDFENQFISDSRKDLRFLGSLRLVPGNPAIEYNPRLILERRTSRLHYHSGPVESRVLDQLVKLTNEGGFGFGYSAEKKTVRDVLALNRDTLFADVNNTLYREELGTWLRYTDGEARLKSDGLSHRCMRFPGKLMKDFFTHPGKYNHGLAKFVVDRYYLNSMKGSRSIAWLRGSTELPSDCLSAGRLLARFWLELTKNDVYMHPFGSVITNPDAKWKFNAMVGEGPDVFFLARLGYSKQPPASYRFPVDSILLKQ